MKKNKIVKSWELKATSQKSFYKYENVINEKKETLEKLEALYIEYTSKLKALYSEMLGKCGDNRQLKSSMKEALEGVKVY